MVEIELTSKDLARLKYHFDRSLTKTDDFKYKQMYERIISDLALADLNYSTEPIETFMEEKNMEDKKLRWKLEIIQEQVHKDEIEQKEAEDEEEE